MTRILSLQALKMPLFIVFLVIAFNASPVTAEALNEGEFKVQLAEAESVSNRVVAKEQCYINEDKKLQKHSEQLQVTVGDLHRSEQQQSAEQERYSVEAGEFQRESRQAQKSMADLSRTIKNTENRIRIKQRELNQCKKDAWIFGFVCDVAAEITGLNQDLRNARAQRQGLEIHRRSLTSQLKDAKSREAKSAETLKGIERELAKTQESIRTIETNIQQIKTSLNQIRTSKQSYTIASDNFKRIFAEFDALDPNSDRRSVVRRLSNASDELGVQITAVTNLLNESRVKLPDGTLACTQ